MKSLFPLALLTVILFAPYSYGQVGINTTNPTTDLDVNGEMRVRNLPTSTNKNISLLATDAQGNLQKGNVFFLSDIKNDEAVSSVRRTISGNRKAYVNLNLETTVVIPANKEGKVIINYSVPVGTSINDDPSSTYLGVTFKKDGYERQVGSRKITLPNLPSGNKISKMNTISNLYTETFASQPTSRSITYSLYGYIEQVASSSKSHQYIFNMWSSSGANYNWGKASMIAQVYIK